MSRHTPGPWFVADWTCFDGDNLLTVEAREPEITEAGQSGIWPDGIRKMKVACAADGSFDRSTNLANARLIAAAPEMLDFLHTARTLLSTVAVAASWNDDTIKQLVPECRAFMAASNKLLDKIQGGGDE